MPRRGGHAVVLGASMAGLTAARVLTDFYDRVSIVERDVLDDTAAPRRGVPQSRQPHALLARCGRILEELFPGIGAELVAGGAHEWRDGDLSRFRMRFGGHLIARTGTVPDPGSVVTLHASRPYLESCVRRRVRQLPSVTVLDGHDVEGLLWRNGAVAGVRLGDRADRATHELPADLVVDATGRGSRTPAFLEQQGYARPREDSLTVNVCYVSVPIRIPDDTLPEFVIADMFQAGRPRGFAMFRCEGDTWILCAGTLGRMVEPPASIRELLAFVGSLMPREVFAAVRSATPLGDIALQRFPANRWRRYDLLTRTPDNLVVVGDAVCSFNPIYGQGMTVAAIEATVLRDCLRRSGDHLPRRFHRAAARAVGLAWKAAAGADLALPEVAGRRTVSVRMSNAFTDRILRAAERDPWMTQEFLQVVGMLKPPSRLLRPAVLTRLARDALRRNPSDDPARDPVMV